jgi:hypothetical protein
MALIIVSHSPTGKTGEGDWASRQSPVSSGFAPNATRAGQIAVVSTPQQPSTGVAGAVAAPTTHKKAQATLLDAASTAGWRCNSTRDFVRQQSTDDGISEERWPRVELCQSVPALRRGC